MNKTDFLNQLEQELCGFPDEEKSIAMAYYREYFEDAGDENEAAVIEELKSPQSIAAQIRANATIKQLELEPKSTRRGWHAAWLTVGMIFAAPIALPLALAAAVVVIALIISLAAIALSFAVAAVATAIAGVCMFIGAFFIISSGWGNVLMSLGLGCVCIAVSIFIFVPTLRWSRTCFHKIALFVSRKIAGRKPE